MSFLEERSAFEGELDAHYATYPGNVAHIEREIRDISARHPEWLPYTRKAAGYDLIANKCAVKVFRHFPFYFEVDVGKPRTDLGAGGVGAWMKREPFGRELAASGSAWWKPCYENGLSLGWAVLDDNHHGLGYDNVFRYGLSGLIKRAEARLKKAGNEKERAFLEAPIAGNRALITLAGRFADEAERLLAGEQDPEIRRRLRRIADTARRVPAQPPETFYEALNTILFMKEVTQSFEGNGISVYGHLDRILFPYYQNDLAKGRITREEAKDLVCFFLAFSDARFGMKRMRNHVGTNGTIGIGGCDAQGTPVFNDITRMIIEAHLEARFVDPKLNARVSPRHPREYFDLLARLIVSGSNNLAIFNDDVVIEANVKMGKALQDCRLYVGGGCQENLLENTEVNSRATMYLNLAQVLLAGFFPERCSFFAEREGIQFATYEGCWAFEEVYDAFLRNLKAVVDAHIAQRNRTEAEGWRYNPCPLHSSTLGDCIEKALDMMEGGARYSFGSVSLTGIGTLVDALYAIRRVVYEPKQVSLSRLKEMLAADFQGEEAFRQYLIHRVPKFGQDDEAIRAFSAKVFADVARVSSGKPNTRGGRYEASLFSFRSFVDLGRKTGATPDGRKAGEYLSQGMSPSTLALGRECTLGQVLRALEPLDLTLYPVVAVLDVKLPVARGCWSQFVVPVIRRFVESGGSVLQINVADRAVLLEAKKHPERHPDLVVRISGFSAYFNTLAETVQDEIIARTETELSR